MVRRPQQRGSNSMLLLRSRKVTGHCAHQQLRQQLHAPDCIIPPASRGCQPALLLGARSERSRGSLPLPAQTRSCTCGLSWRPRKPSPGPATPCLLHAASASTAEILLAALQIRLCLVWRMASLDSMRTPSRAWQCCRCLLRLQLQRCRHHESGLWAGCRPTARWRDLRVQQPSSLLWPSLRSPC
jgi:hypothetical protein